jgi:ADP-heptose:LPS heptosyltransferase
MELFVKPRYNHRLPAKPSTICIIAQEKIGDFILLTPLFPLLKKYFPNIYITVLASKYNYNLFQQLPDVDEVFCPKSNYWQFYKDIKHRKFDILYNPKDHSSRTFLILTAIIKAEYKIGIRGFHNRKYYDYLFEIPLHTYIVEKNLAICKLFNIRITKKDLIPKLPEPHNEQNVEYWKSFKKPIIGINLSAGSRFREWKEKKWLQFFEHFSNENASFLLIGMPDKKDMMERISSKYKNIFIMKRAKNIIELNEYTSHLDIVITPDTSVLHLSQINDLPTICLFQKNIDNIKRFYRQSPKTQIICSPTDDINDIITVLIAEKTKSILKTIASV